MRLSFKYCKWLPMQTTLVVFCMLAALADIPARGTELKQQTAASFDRYVCAVEARMDDELRLDQFLAIDRLPDLRVRRLIINFDKAKSISKNYMPGKTITRFIFRVAISITGWE
jgi:hypothetical protein